MADSVRIKRIKFYYSGFNALRSDPAILGELTRRANVIMGAAGGYPDFDVHVDTTKSRARATIVTATPKGMEMEATDRSLTRALDAGRG